MVLWTEVDDICLFFGVSASRLNKGHTLLRVPLLVLQHCYNFSLLKTHLTHRNIWISATTKLRAIPYVLLQEGVFVQFVHYSRRNRTYIWLNQYKTVFSPTFGAVGMNISTIPLLSTSQNRKDQLFALAGTINCKISLLARLIRQDWRISGRPLQGGDTLGNYLAFKCRPD